MTSRARWANIWLRTHLALIASLLLSSAASASWQMKEFPILYSSGWPAEAVSERMTQQLALQIAASHYNTVMCEPSELELVAKAGLRCLVIGRSQGGPDWIGEAVSPSVVHGLASEPAVWGYYVTDEPDNKNWRRGTTFQQLAGRIKDYRSADPNHLAWINVTSATGSLLSDYMEVVRPDFLSFDLYRWWAKESDWWRGLEAHRNAALMAHVPMIMWIESNSSEKRFNAHLPPPEGNEAKLRWSVYTSLAYGSKGVQWFLGTTNGDVAQINAELSALGPTLIHLESKHVFHTSKVPLEGLPLPQGGWYFTDAQDLVVGEFEKPGDSHASYFLIANKSIDHETDAVFEFRRPVSALEEVSKQSADRTALPMDRRAAATYVRLHLAAGDGRLIRVEAK